MSKYLFTEDELANLYREAYTNGRNEHHLWHPVELAAENFVVWLDLHGKQYEFNDPALDSIKREPVIKPLDLKVGDHITRAVWMQNVNDGCLMDDDGFGYLAGNDTVSDVVIYPSDVIGKVYNWPEWATHVLWFNR